MMQWLCLAAALAASVALAALQNGDFEQGIAGWSTGHTWYEQPKGAGMSVIEVADGEGRDGSKALKITGAGNRGIAMQVFAASKGRYRIAGWIRTENLGDAAHPANAPRRRDPRAAVASRIPARTCLHP